MAETLEASENTSAPKNWPGVKTGPQNMPCITITWRKSMTRLLMWMSSLQFQKPWNQCRKYKNTTDVGTRRLIEVNRETMEEALKFLTRNQIHYRTFWWPQKKRQSNWREVPWQQSQSVSMECRWTSTKLGWRPFLSDTARCMMSRKRSVKPELPPGSFSSQRVDVPDKIRLVVAEGRRLYCWSSCASGHISKACYRKNAVSQPSQAVAVEVFQQCTRWWLKGDGH